MVVAEVEVGEVRVEEVEISLQNLWYHIIKHYLDVILPTEYIVQYLY